MDLKKYDFGLDSIHQRAHPEVELSQHITTLAGVKGSDTDLMQP